MTEEPPVPSKPARRRPKRKKPAGSSKPVGRTAAPEATWPRRLLFAAGALLVVGLASVGTGESEPGRWITLGALLLAIYAIHTFGRLGPEPGHE